MIQDTIASLNEDTKAVLDFYESLYDKEFSEQFISVQKMFKRYKSSDKPITDTELEDILTGLPLELFSIAEKLNSLRLSEQVVKLKSRDKKITPELKEEYAILDSVYSSVIERVENQISFSRELIMGAKKIWDARRKTESMNPVTPPKSKELPEYDYANGIHQKSYI